MEDNKTIVPGKMRIISLEEHFVTPEFMKGPGQEILQMAKSAQAHPEVAKGLEKLIAQLSDIGEGRIEAMDVVGIDIQVLSLTSPGVEQLHKQDAISLSRDVNDVLAAAITKYPSRLAGFAALPLAAPVIAADELERLVTQHGFKGALINGHIQGRYLDDAFFWPVLERAEKLKVPLYIHPTPPPQQVVDISYKGNYSPAIAAMLATTAWGWHIETANHLLRLIVSGAFDKYPDLQIIVGHLGETIPFMIPRLELGLPKQITKLERSVGEYLRQNVHYTFGGFNWTQAFLDLLLQVGADRIMFSADFPYSSMSEACTFLEKLSISPADRGRIAHGNAESLFRF